MRILIALIFIAVASTATAQIRDIQLRADTMGGGYDSLLVMLTDTADASPTKGLGSWSTVWSLAQLLDPYIGGGSGATDLTIEGAGPTYTIASSTGTDVIIAAGGINALSETPANTLVITATEVDGDATNEIQDITVTGASQPFTVDLSGDATDMTMTGAGITTITRSSNAITFTSTEVDGSTTNELNTIEEGNVSVQSSNTNIDFQTLFDVAADGAGEVNVSLDLSESTTVTTVESDDYMIMHDAGSAQHQKILWTDIYDELISFEESNVNEGGGNTIDFGLGIDLSVAAGEADVTLDFNEFTTDAATEGDEYVIVYDPSAGVHEKVLVTSVSGGFDGNGFFDSGNDGANIPTGMNGVLVGTWQLGDGSESDLYVDGPNDRIGMGTASPSYGVHVVNNSGMAVESETAGTGGLILKLEGKADGGTTNTQQTMLQMAFTDADYASGIEQTALEVTLDKQSDLTQWSTITMRMKENTDADVMVFEKNVDFSANTTESHIAMNGGRAYTQNYEWTATGTDLALDRSYNIVNVSGAGAVGDELTLPEVASTLDNFDPSITAAQCQVGQEYTITNFRAGTNLIIRVFAGDNINNGGTTATLVPGDSMIFKCVRFSGGVGYWYVYD